MIKSINLAILGAANYDLSLEQTLRNSFGSTATLYINNFSNTELSAPEKTQAIIIDVDQYASPEFLENPKAHIKSLRTASPDASIIVVSNDFSVTDVTDDPETENKQISWLSAGADDGMSFEGRRRPNLALAERLNNIFKRRSKLNKSKKENSYNVIKRGLLTLDPDKHHAEFNGVEISSLTVSEFSILKCITQAMDVPKSRNQIMEYMIDDNALEGIKDDTRTIDSHIKRLRKKLKAVGCENAIKMVYGVGYSFESPTVASPAPQSKETIKLAI